MLLLLSFINGIIYFLESTTAVMTNKNIPPTILNAFSIILLSLLALSPLFAPIIPNIMATIPKGIPAINKPIIQMIDCVL